MLISLLLVSLLACRHNATQPIESQAKETGEVGFSEELPFENKPLAESGLSTSTPLLPKQEVKGEKEWQSIALPPQPEPLYRVAAFEAPIAKVLLNLARQANKDLWLDPAIDGTVTLTAEAQPLKVLIAQLAEQVGALSDISSEQIRLILDRPVWRSYPVDYVNFTKRTHATSALTLSVGQGTSSGLSSAKASQFEMSVTSEQDFWRALTENLAAIVEPVERTPPKQSASERRLSTNQVSPQAQLEIENPSFMTQSKVVIHKESALVSILTTHKRHQVVADYLARLSKRMQQQVLIEASVVEVELNEAYQAGIDWQAQVNRDTGSLSLSQALLGVNLAHSPHFALGVAKSRGWNLDLGLRLLQQFGKTKVLSRPKIQVLNNQSSLLKVVDNQVYFTVKVQTQAATNTTAGVTTFETQVHSVPVGFMMNLQPFIGEDGMVSLSIRPSLSRIVDYVSDPNPELAKQNIASQIPVIQQREMESILRLKDQQVAIIGGLIQQVQVKERRGIPGLMDSNWFGSWFSYQETVSKKSELVIFIRPSILPLDSNVMAGRDFK